jgi:hypothetical protein
MVVKVMPMELVCSAAWTAGTRSRDARSRAQQVVFIGCNQCGISNDIETKTGKYRLFMQHTGKAAE